MQISLAEQMSSRDVPMSGRGARQMDSGKYSKAMSDLEVRFGRVVVCATVHPLHTKFAKRLGASLSETTI